MSSHRRSGVALKVGSFCLLAVGLLIAGCSSVTVRGRVIEGPVNIIVVVPEGDDRLSDPDSLGLEGIDVSVDVPGLDSPKRTTTDNEGRFSFKIGGKAKTGRGIAVGARGEGWLPEETTTPFPPMDHRLLIVLQRR